LLGAELASLGLCAEATAELERFARPARRHPQALLRALPLFSRCRRFDRALTLAQGALDAAHEGDRPALLAFLYPAAYPQEVERSARRTRLDPYLLLAVARRESVFRPDARSAAGAVGLVQVLPATAARIAAVLGRPPPEPEALADPQTALDLGAWYLADLLGAFGDPAVAAAAYNAGPRAVRRWVNQGRGRPLDEWVEDIPFRETRYYVRYVIGGWSAYRILAGGGAPRLAKTVPGPKAGVEF
jgi:soluble lytic murein transglycosylase